MNAIVQDEYGPAPEDVLRPGEIDKPTIDRLQAGRHTTDDFADGARRYDVILDIGGNRRLSHLRRALTARGRLVIVGGETDGRWLGSADRQLRAIVLSPFADQKLGTVVASKNAEDLIVLREPIEAGKIAATTRPGARPSSARSAPRGGSARARRSRLRPRPEGGTRA
jgi:hypothetical protein